MKIYKKNSKVIGNVQTDGEVFVEFIGGSRVRFVVVGYQTFETEITDIQNEAGAQIATNRTELEAYLESFFF